MLRSVLSALEQNEVGEVLLIDDGSDDNGIDKVKSRFSEESRIRYFSSGGKQKGAGAARNTGIENVKFEFISFLDADDYMLPERFEKTRTVFAQFPEVDGVYEPLGRSGSDEVTMMTERVDPSSLFFSMEPFGKKGHFSVCGLTVKTDALGPSLKFSEGLEIGEDTEWLARLSLKRNLYAGHLKDSVVMRTVHLANTTKQSKRSKTDKVLMSKMLIEWSIAQEQPKEVRDLLAELFLKYHYEENHILSSKRFIQRKYSDLRAAGFLLYSSSGFWSLPKVRYFLKTIFGFPVKNHIDYYQLNEGD